MNGSAAHMDAESRRILFGTDEPLPASVRLRAGPLTLALRDDALHDLAWDGEPTWQAVTFPYRDGDWWTPPSVPEAVEHSQRDGGFRAEVRGAFVTAPALRTRFSATADWEGRLRVEAEAVPEGDLLTNRTGLCLLLPTAAGGDAIEIEHEDGRTTRSTIPTLVPPWPPFTAIRALRWRLAPHRWAVAAFSGDSFEFEDQRNNADLSFKVYSRSNMMPRPYRLEAGVPVRQELQLWMEAISSPVRRTRDGAPVGEDGEEPAVSGATGRPVVDPVPALSSPTALREGETSVPPSHPDEGEPPLPRFGLALAPEGDREHLGRVVRTLRPAFLHASLDAAALATADLPDPAETGAPLRLELMLGDLPLGSAHLATLARDPPEAVGMFPSRPRDVEALRRAIPGVRVGGGTPHFFAQINRIEGLGPVDHLTFTLSPLVHGAGDTEVMACAGAVSGLVETLRRRWPCLPIELGPSAIAMRSSPLGRLPPSDGRRRQAMASDDPRARGLFGAAWLLALAAACTEAGIAAATLMAVEGPSGVASRHGAEVLWHPASAVLARLTAPAGILPSPVPPTPFLAALALRRGGTRELLLANLRPDPVEVAIDGWAADADLAVLDEAALRAAGPARGGPPPFAPRPATGTLTLSPYAVASLIDDTGRRETAG